jgi:hypothetical protein
LSRGTVMGFVPPVDAVGLAPAVAALVPDVDGEPDDVLGDLGPASNRPACVRTLLPSLRSLWTRKARPAPWRSGMP